MFRSCANLYTPAATHRGENKIVVVVVYIFCGFPIKPRNLQLKNKLPLLQLETPLDFLSKDCCCRFSLYGLFLSALCSRIFCAGLENNKNITRDIPEN